jgi:hypothetical protein
MAIKKTIRADQVKARQAIFINFHAAYAVAVEQQGEGGLFKIEWMDAHTGDGYIRDHQMSGSVELPALPDGFIWPSPMAEAERPLDWQRRGLQYTATGYGTKIPTSKVIKWSDGKVRRVYCDIYSNAGSCYCMICGCKVSVEGFNLIRGATI